jgi:hypothetical protein
MTLPLRLDHVADLTIEIAQPLEVGLTATGIRRVIPIRGGQVTGPVLTGVIRSGGADFQVLRPDGVTELQARYVIETPEGLVYIENTGIRHGSPEAMERLRRGEFVDPSEIYFRTTPRFETAVPGLQWLATRLFVGAAARYPDRVEVSVYLAA